MSETQPNGDQTREQDTSIHHEIIQDPELIQRTLIKISQVFSRFNTASMHSHRREQPIGFRTPESNSIEVQMADMIDGRLQTRRDAGPKVIHQYGNIFGSLRQIDIFNDILEIEGERNTDDENNIVLYFELDTESRIIVGTYCCAVGLKNLDGFIFGESDMWGAWVLRYAEQ